VHPKSGKKTITFQSWDPRIVAQTEDHLKTEFPAHLSHRSGLSNDVFSWMRSCFQNGMGSKQFSDALRVQHLLKHDERHLQYLQYLMRHALSGWVGEKYETFLPFDDTSLDGPHGFVPSSQWLRDMYDTFMEEHSSHFNQHMSMLSGEICAIDHSHKVDICLMCCQF